MRHRTERHNNRKRIDKNTTYIKQITENKENKTTNNRTRRPHTIYEET